VLALLRLRATYWIFSFPQLGCPLVFSSDTFLLLPLRRTSRIFLTPIGGFPPFFLPSETSHLDCFVFFFSGVKLRCSSFVWLVHVALFFLPFDVVVMKFFFSPVVRFFSFSFRLRLESGRGKIPPFHPHEKRLLSFPHLTEFFVPLLF